MPDAAVKIACARRSIDLRAGKNAVEAWLEDDFHHFGIEMQHNGKEVTAVNGLARRYPRDTCPGAVGILQELVGTPLNPRCTELGAHTNMRLHCTHMYDLLGLAIAHAANGREHRRYDAVIPDRQSHHGGGMEHLMSGSTSPRLYRDGELTMAWEIEGNLITGPAPYTDLSMGRGFRQWTENQDVDTAEAAHVLRRATMIALGRLVDMQNLPPGGSKETAGLCHSYQPEVAQRSSMTIASTRDFSNNPEGLLQDLRG